VIHPGGFTEWLSNLSVLQICAAVVVLTAIRLLSVQVLRWPNRLAQGWSRGLGRTLIEAVDSLLYACAIAFLLFKPLIAQPFYIPTGSMEPTLRGDNEDNDRVWVDKLGYRLHLPSRGDVVVFIPPPAAVDGEDLGTGDAPTPFIKRLIGVGGDRIQVHAGIIVVNGQVYSHSDIRHDLATAGWFGSGDPEADTEEFRAVHHVKFVDDGVLADGRLVDKQTLSQIVVGSANADVVVRPGVVIRNGQVLNEPYIAEDPDYDLQIYDGQSLKNNYGVDDDERYKLNGMVISKQLYDSLVQTPPGTVPAGTYFMMGDNRNDSEDSTEWGPLVSEPLIGKAEAIFWPLGRMKPL
jgi:signal peptidase I